MNRDHFKGQSVLEHLREARKKGAEAMAENHGVEMPGYLAAAADGAREICLMVAAIYLLFEPKVEVLLIFCLAFTIWKTARSALLGWARLERLHRLIEEERWEIEHDRKQEEKELVAMYEAKGFSGQLLKDVVSTLSADDNRLLQIMLEEEMGLKLEVYEHPLKQATGAALSTGVVGALLCGISIFGTTTLLLTISLIIGCSALAMAWMDKNRKLEAVIWNLASAGFGLGSIYFLRQLL